MDETIVKRFWSKVKKTKGCWLWTASRHPRGYGYFGIGSKIYRAHRVAYEISCGPIPKGLCVLHHCDNPQCVRPDHLFLGTLSDNARDATEKGRQHIPQNVGANNPMAKLNPKKVREIRWMKASGASSDDLAKKFGVAKRTIRSVVNREYWRDVD